MVHLNGRLALPLHPHAQPTLRSYIPRDRLYFRASSVSSTLSHPSPHFYPSHSLTPALAFLLLCFPLLPAAAGRSKACASSHSCTNSERNNGATKIESTRTPKGGKINDNGRGPHRTGATNPASVRRSTSFFTYFFL